MGKLVKLIGSGIGLASEAFASLKTGKAEKAVPSHPSRQEAGESSRTAAQRTPGHAPPVYAEVDDEHASHLIASGKALPVDAKEEHIVREKQAQDDEDTTSEEGDEEHWDLDDAIEAQTTPHSEDETEQDSNVLT